MLLLDTLLLPANPVGKPVPAHQLFQYVPNQAQMVLHVDLNSIRTHFEKSIQDLGKQSFVAKEPMVNRMFGRFNRMYKMMISRAEKQLMIKLDQVRFVTMAFGLKNGPKKPDILITFHGKFDIKSLENLLASKRVKAKRETIKGYTFFFHPNNNKPLITGYE